MNRIKSGSRKNKAHTNTNRKIIFANIFFIASLLAFLFFSFKFQLATNLGNLWVLFCFASMIPHLVGFLISLRAYEISKESLLLGVSVLSIFANLAFPVLGFIWMTR